jgi:hypothetical protein
MFQQRKIAYNIAGHFRPMYDTKYVFDSQNDRNAAIIIHTKMLILDINKTSKMYFIQFT